jgi:hypothetical protein
MSHGREAARDLRYGRRGGRWADSGSGHLLEELADAKAAHRCDTPKAAASCALCTPGLNDQTLVPRPTDETGWRAAARMAHARAAAGAPVSDLDREAMLRHPRTPSLWPDGEPYGDPVDPATLPAVAGRGPSTVGADGLPAAAPTAEDPWGEAIAGSERAAGRWTRAERDLVDAAIRAVATMLDEFTADDVWSELAGRVPVTKGLTSRLLVAARAGVMVNSGRTTIARRGGEHDHAQRLTIWRSTAADLEATA